MNGSIRNIKIHYSHKKKYSLETCAQLLFMLLQDFFASARPHKLQKKQKKTKRAVNYSYYLKSNNIIDQMKATVTEKNRFIRD